MLLPGVQAVLSFQLVAVTNQRFVLLTPVEQALYLAAFLLLALAMGLIIAPAGLPAGRARLGHEPVR